jgi:moderate conductance mechanosensitive channel
MVNTIQEWSTHLWQWSINHGVLILLYLSTGWLINKIVFRFIDKITRMALVSDKQTSLEAEEKRKKTLIEIFTWATRLIVWGIIFMMVLKELGIPIGPIIASAGIIGLAFGFGGQYLIRDLITGFFLILENQYRIGDFVYINGVEGLVEKISLRLTTLRDVDGTVHFIPHGEIKLVSNAAKEFANINLDIGVAYDTNVKLLIEVINRVGKELKEDKAYGEEITKAPHFERIQEFADSAIIVKIKGETRALSQWDITGELRLRLKYAFDEAGIVIPFPQMVVHQAKEIIKK